MNELLKGITINFSSKMWENSLYCVQVSYHYTHTGTNL
jgi:hypothetical protein